MSHADPHRDDSRGIIKLVLEGTVLNPNIINMVLTLQLLFATK